MTTGRRPTIREVASRAGVSVGTVSHVLTGRRAVREATRLAVERAVAELGFRPDHAARSLIGRRGRGGPVVPEGAPRLTTVGYVSADYTARMAVLPHRGDRAEALAIDKTLGGPAANVAVMAAGLGPPFAVHAELLARFGDDADSDWAIHLLAARRVAAVPIGPRAGQRLGRAIILVEGSGARTILYEPLAAPAAALRRYLGALPRPAGRHVLHVQGHHAPELLGGIAEARGLGLATSVHLTGLSHVWRTAEGLARLLPGFDFAFLNRETAAAITGIQGPAEELVRRLERLMAGTTGCVILTLDEAGALLLRAGRTPIPAQALAVQPVDTTGAGDCLVGVFLALWLNGVEDAMALGHAVRAASRSITVAGAQELVLTAADLEEAGIAA